MPTTIDPELLERFRNGRIGHGANSVQDGDDCLCIQQWLAGMSREAPMAGTPTDHPKGVCPVINRFAIRLNDRFGYGEQGDARRRAFFTEDLALGMLNTRSTPEVEQERKRMLRDWAYKEALPKYLDAAKLHDIAVEVSENPGDPGVLWKARDAAWKVRCEWRDNLRERVTAAVTAQLGDKPAAAAADAVAAAVAAADAVAVAVAAADAAAVDAWDRWGDAWNKVYRAVYDAVRAKYDEIVRTDERFAFVPELNESARKLLRDLCALGRDENAA